MIKIYKVLSVILVITVVSCVFAYPNYSSFDLRDFIKWCSENISEPPAIFADFSEMKNDLAEGILSALSALVFPLRFVIWLVPTLISFVQYFFFNDKPVVSLS